MEFASKTHLQKPHTTETAKQIRQVGRLYVWLPPGPGRGGVLQVKKPSSAGLATSASEGFSYKITLYKTRDKHKNKLEHPTKLTTRTTKRTINTTV